MNRATADNQSAQADEARKFPVDIGVPSHDTIAVRFESPESFYFETREQYRAFLGFARSVEEKTGVAPVFYAGG
jgi:hypothetical protein